MMSRTADSTGTTVYAQAVPEAAVPQPRGTPRALVIDADLEACDPEELDDLGQHLRTLHRI
jgi:hypothetical protein